ncbi:hypothetical protein HanXRQr2_Chr14g0653421 [Helianthus annuus]|uniref:Uncharacterized protein n=1 Tax=Helianthus annuus TaxID=4232 RepID=A0A9K3EAC2_HELAN|nr:hypothetical protein HanXRQr2_Chr14g0653421 [Helianthus annuus]
MTWPPWFVPKKWSRSQREDEEGFQQRVICKLVDLSLFCLLCSSSVHGKYLKY